MGEEGASQGAGGLHVVAASPSAPPLSGVLSPRNEFFVSQRAATDFELSRLDTLSLEEQEILANIQELQLQLMQLRAEEEEDSDEEPADGHKTAGTPGNQLIVVSNNLPVLLERQPQTGRWKATKTTGGLDKLMCLTGVRAEMNFLWVGWVGQHIPKSEHEAVRRLLLQHNCLPVFLSSDVASRHTGFSSEVLWSLFHYVSEPVAFTFTGGNSNFHSTKRFSKQDWRAYESANESFADAIAEIYNEGDVVWVHDYHLMLLPSLLRQRIPPCQIGWFLHTPFPASDVYCRLPVRSQLLTGVLQADLLGFQTFDYERHFLSTCHRLLGVECSHRGVRSTLADRDHFTSIGVFPIGISLEPFARAASSPPTLNRVNELHDKFGGKRIILGIDRLDNIKGIPHKMLAMETLLNRFPEWQHNVVLVQIGISSRSGVVETKSTNASGGPGEGSHRLSSNSATSDSANVLPRTSSYPIVAQGGSTGSDSPIQGGLAESPPRAFLEELSEAVEKNRTSSTQLPKLDKKTIVQAYRNAQNRVIILDYDRTLTPQHSLLPLAAVGPNFKSLLDALSADKRNTVFIVSGRERKFLETWLNGVRVGVAAEDGFFYRMNLSNTREQWKTMSKFQYDVVSARSGASTTATVAGVGSVGGGSLDASYSSDAHSMMHMSMGSMPSYSQHDSAPASNETGGGGSVVQTDDSFGGDDMSWKDLVLPTMLLFTDRTPGSYIEDKESSLTWHYGDADPHFGSWQAKDLQIILERQLIGTALEVYQGHMSVSVEHEGCTKTRVLEGILKHLSLPEQITKKNEQEVDFVLCVCDDVTDDQMFQTMHTLVIESNERHDERKRKEEQAENERIRRNSIAMGNSPPVQIHAQPVPSAAHVSKAKPRMPRPRGGNGVTDELEPAKKVKTGVKKHGQNDKMTGAAAAAVRGHEDYATDDDDELDVSNSVDDDNKVAFSRLQKVPVRLAEDVSIFAVIVGPDVQHSGGRHASSFAVDSLADVRKVLKEFVDESRKGGSGLGTTSAVPAVSTRNDAK
ncbi:hypothetical protein BBO99_00005047 [Phytophthora kernoviae]|uniref:Uncharacterized protein n=1 Tax=Phytophthora kernoviae TaxID=325452 RepID=A0A3R7JTW7_9STRA|nr:hypothetical protein JM16_004758 [Phytophthora kernoviae]KAG2526631.1 hypothetical protein JM18_004288 [Phytophthora kernoviae]RLN79731.1 hypothetical protein BBO99_00005047 [Phytophthora kernoviae]